jgi:hypothetical protein
MVSVGVKEGDWIEYTVATTGAPPKEFEVTWAKMEIVHVEGKTIMSNVTTKAANGSLSSIEMFFDLEKGQVGAWFVIPAALNIGDSFWDASLGRNVTIEGEEQLMFAGANRAVTNATTSQRIKYWDKATGIFVECFDVFEDYSINATAIRTNMWAPQSFEVQQNAGKAGLLVVTIAIATTLLLTAIKKGVQRWKPD